MSWCAVTRTCSSIARSALRASSTPGALACRSSSRPAAYWLRLGPGVELRRTDYDLAAAAAAVRRTAYPGADEFARVNVLEPPDMLEAFTQYGLAQIGGAAGGA